jgi:hypothetical protein
MENKFKIGSYVKYRDKIAIVTEYYSEDMCSAADPWYRIQYACINDFGFPEKGSHPESNLKIAKREEFIAQRKLSIEKRIKETEEKLYRLKEMINAL